jgi:hypothetical protein
MLQICRRMGRSDLNSFSPENKGPSLRNDYFIHSCMCFFYGFVRRAKQTVCQYTTVSTHLPPRCSFTVCLAPSGAPPAMPLPFAPVQSEQCSSRFRCRRDPTHPRHEEVLSGDGARNLFSIDRYCLRYILTVSSNPRPVFFRDVAQRTSLSPAVICPQIQRV